MRPAHVSPTLTRRTLSLSLAAACAGLLTHAAPARADGPTATEIAAKVQAFYDSTKTYQADFKQTYSIKVQNVKKVSEGTVRFAKPGKISFRYKKPNGNRVVSDGKVIKVYEADNQQLFRSKVTRSQYPAALAFLMGEGKLMRDFTLKMLDAAQLKMENGYVLEATPKEATPAYKKMLLYVDGPTSQVRRVLILDAQGNKNRFDFKTPVVNETIADSEFVFEAPPGTTVVEQ